MRGEAKLQPSKAAPRKTGLFYGWVVVGVMAAAGAVSMAMGTLNYGLFIKPMGDELGIGRATFGWAQTMRQLASAATSPWVGRIIDRFGSRVLLAVSALITGAALVGVGYISHGWQLVALFAVMGIVGMSGPGALVTSVPVAKWFVRQRGKAMSFMSLGIPVGGLIFVPLTQLFIDGFGWRHAWIVLAAIGTGVLVPLSLLFIRRQPEDMGLLPDGAAPAMLSATPMGGSNPGPPAPDGGEHSWTREEAVRSPAFWRLVAVFSLVTLAVTSAGVHRIPHFMDRGLDPRVVAYATALDALAAGVAMFIQGLLVARFPARFLGAGGFVILAAALYMTIIADGNLLMFTSMIVFGFGAGGLMIMQTYLWAEYFGREHLGAIRGVVMPVTLVFGGAGAPLAGYVRDATGSYSAIWYVGIGVVLLGAVLLAATPPPRMKQGAALGTSPVPTKPPGKVR